MVRRPHRDTAITAAVLVAALAGCTSGGSTPTAKPTFSPPSLSAHAVAKARAAARRHAVALAHLQAEATAAPCTGRALRMRQIAVGAGAGTYYQTFMLRNITRRACVVERLGAVYTDSNLRPVGHISASPGRILDDSEAKLVQRRALLAGERVFIRVGTGNPLNYANGCDTAPVADEVVLVNAARFAIPTSYGATACTIKGGAPGIVWAVQRPRGSLSPRGLAQPHLA